MEHTTIKHIAQQRDNAARLKIQSIKVLIEEKEENTQFYKNKVQQISDYIKEELALVTDLINYIEKEYEVVKDLDLNNNEIGYIKSKMKYIQDSILDVLGYYKTYKKTLEDHQIQDITSKKVNKNYLKKYSEATRKNFVERWLKNFNYEKFEEIQNKYYPAIGQDDSKLTEFTKKYITNKKDNASGIAQYSLNKIIEEVGILVDILKNLTTIIEQERFVIASKTRIPWYKRIFKR
ncbi:MAG: hypothetical protein ACMXX6_01695 [Candidatus Woesearchaeota archaeon]